MRAFDQLNEQEQAEAVNIKTGALLNAIVEGAIRFNDRINGDTMQAAIDAAKREADQLHTPWFAGEIIMEATYLEQSRDSRSARPRAASVVKLSDAIEGMARCTAEDAFYPDPGEYVIRLSGANAGGADHE